MAKQFAEKRHPRASEAKALTETKGIIAALKTLRHPNSEFFSKLFSRGFVAALTAWFKPRPFKAALQSRALYGKIKSGNG